MSEKIRLIESIQPDGSSVLRTESGEVLERNPPGTFYFYPNNEGVAWALSYDLSSSDFRLLYPNQPKEQPK